MTDSASHKQYVVVYRAVSALRFTEDGYFKFNGVRTPNGTVDLTFGTRYDDAGFESKIPRELWIDARGSAPSLEHAINDFGASASMFLQLLTVSENAAIFHPAVHLAYDASEGATERDFFQSFLVDERGIPRITRRFHAQASRAFVEGVSRL
jgi:hypothetical protein